MKGNVGRTDRILRIVAGLALLGLGLAFGSWWGLVGFIPLVTAVVGFCPAYTMFGISTCAKEGCDVVIPDTSGDNERSGLK